MTNDRRTMRTERASRDLGVVVGGRVRAGATRQGELVSGICEHLRATVAVTVHRVRLPTYGKDWYDGPHYYAVLGFISVSYSPWEGRPIALERRLGRWRLMFYQSVVQDTGWWFAIGRRTNTDGIRVRTPLGLLLLTKEPS